MTSRKANASRRLSRPTKRKPVRPPRPSPPVEQQKKQGPLPSEVVVPKSAQHVAGNGHGIKQTEASESSSAIPTAPPKPIDPKKETMIPVKEAAHRLKKSADTVYTWLRAGRLRGWQLGGNRCAVLVDAASVEEALVCEMGPSRKDRTG